MVSIFTKNVDSVSIKGLLHLHLNCPAINLKTLQAIIDANKKLEEALITLIDHTVHPTPQFLDVSGLQSLRSFQLLADNNNNNIVPVSFGDYHTRLEHV